MEPLANSGVVRPEEAIFRKGSTTYYWSSKFFPKEIRQDVLKLYSFVRVVDDYVDQQPAQAERFAAVRSRFEALQRGVADPSSNTRIDALDERVVHNYREVALKYEFEPFWATAFLDSMQMDINERQYDTLRDSLEYVYGSAEVIGLMMSRIMGLSPETDEFAQMQGRAMQWINFLRDIAEDTGLGRCYIPGSELARFGLSNLHEDTAHAQPDAFRAVMRIELARYEEWQAIAREGFGYIPYRLRIPLKTAVDMYDWTARQIAKDPFIVFDKKIKPRKVRVVSRATRNLLHAI